jgi:hypothetical protein
MESSVRTIQRWESVGVVIAATLLLLLIVAAPATAATPAFDQYRISLWPEYDDPRMLVILEPALNASERLPYEYAQDVPADAQVNMACQIAADGQHECQPYDKADEGDASQVSFTAPSRRQLYLEYYTDLLAGKRPEDRNMTYQFTAPADIASLQLEVKQPKDAVGFKMYPEPTGTRTDAEGFTWAQYAQSDVAAGQTLAVTLDYSRPSWEPPFQAGAQSGSPGAGGDAAAPAPGGPVPGGTQGQAPGSGSGTLNSLAILLAAVIVSGTVWMVFGRRSQTSSGGKGRSNGPSRKNGKKSRGRK